MYETGNKLLSRSAISQMRVRKKKTLISYIFIESFPAFSFFFEAPFSNLRYRWMPLVKDASSMGFDS
jgi:hypothetical protein